MDLQEASTEFSEFQSLHRTKPLKR